MVVNKKTEYEGSFETASQRILHNQITKTNKQTALVEDDLESFLKMIKIYFEERTLPKKGTHLGNYYRSLFVYWQNDYDVRVFMSLPDLQSKILYLREYCQSFETYVNAEASYLSIRTWPVFMFWHHDYL